jgi:enoyl-CoA hydratase/carnithine racemase
MPGAAVVERRGAVATITLNRPDRRNRLDDELVRALADACAQVASDDCRVVLLAGSGPAFAIGMVPPPAPGALAGISPAEAVAALRKPVVAWIAGDCFDQGLELALGCDVRLADPGAAFAIRHVRDGALPWDGGTQRLVRAVGRAQALSMLLTGDVLSAQEAAAAGLVQRVCSRDEAEQLAGRMAEAGPIAAAYAKEATGASRDLTLEQGLRLEADLSILLHPTHDRAEGLRRFTEKRPPRFEGG